MVLGYRLVLQVPSTQIATDTGETLHFREISSVQPLPPTTTPLETQEIDIPRRQPSEPTVTNRERPTSNLLIKVVDEETGGAIYGATITPLDESLTRPIQTSATTDHDGIASLDRSSLVGPITTSANGYIPRIDDLTPITSTKEVRLSRATTITGQLVCHRKEPIRAVLRVVAWESNRYKPSETSLDLARSNLSTPDCLVGLSDSSGHFEIDGIDANKRYRVAASGSGSVSLSSASVTAGQHLNLVCDGLYGAFVRIRDENGNLPRVSESVHNNGRFGRYSYPDSARFASQWLAEVGGVSTAITSGARVLDRLFLCTGRTLENEIGPFRVWYTVPGYEELHGRFNVSRLVDQIPCKELTLHEVSGRKGTLVVKMDGLSLPTKGRSRLVGTLYLTSENKSRVEASVMSHMTPSIEIEHLPEGIYSVRFESYLGIYCAPALGDPPAQVFVHGGEVPASITLDLTRGGSVECVFLEESGHKIDRVVRIRLKPTDPGVHSPNDRTYIAGPYLIDCVPPGQYEILAHINTDVEQHGGQAVMKFKDVRGPIIEVGEASGHQTIEIPVPSCDSP